MALTAGVFVELWLDELCKREPKDGPATMRRWYLALTSGRREGAANDNGADIDAEGARKLSDMCRKCTKRCALPLP